MNGKKIAIFASGSGSNAMNLIAYFKNDPLIEVAFVLSNRKDAPIVDKATQAGVHTIICSNEEAADGQFLVDLCKKHQINWIVLAGYLRLIPSELIQYFPERMINLHPSLLPNYGGKGMYGHHVHEAVLANGEKRTGITIHFVNEQFDKGAIIAQFQTSIAGFTAIEQIESAIRVLEHSYLPVVVKTTIVNSHE